MKFLHRFSKNTDIELHENGTVGAESFHEDRETDTDMTELIVAFRNFAKIHQNEHKSSIIFSSGVTFSFIVSKRHSD
jgi:hypothetical protein